MKYWWWKQLQLWSARRTLGNHFLSVSIHEIATTPIRLTIPTIYQIYEVKYIKHMKTTDIPNVVQIWKLKTRLLKQISNIANIATTPNRLTTTDILIMVHYNEYQISPKLLPNLFGSLPPIYEMWYRYENEKLNCYNRYKHYYHTYCGCKKISIHPYSAQCWSYIKINVFPPEAKINFPLKERFLYCTATTTNEPLSCELCFKFLSPNRSVLPTGQFRCKYGFIGWVKSSIEKIVTLKCCLFETTLK